MIHKIAFLSLLRKLFYVPLRYKDICDQQLPDSMVIYGYNSALWTFSKIEKPTRFKLYESEHGGCGLSCPQKWKNYIIEWIIADRLFISKKDYRKINTASSPSPKV